MRGIIAAIVCALALLIGAQAPTGSVSVCKERPVINVPVQLRQANWLSAPIKRGTHVEREGCCSWASLVTDLRFVGQPELANKVKATQAGGESPESLTSKMAAMGIRFAWTIEDNDVAFLEKALASRRGCMVQIDEDTPEENARQIAELGYNETHMVVLAHLDSDSACLIDCNHPSINRWFTRDKFIEMWEDAGSWAICPLYTPVPPLSK